MTGRRFARKYAKCSALICEWQRIERKLEILERLLPKRTTKLVKKQERDP